MVESSKDRRIDPLGIGPNAALLRWAQTPTNMNHSSVGDGVNIVGHRFAAPIDNAFNTYISKLDFNAGSNHTFFWRDAEDDAVAIEPAHSWRRSDTDHRETAAGAFAMGYSWIVNPRVVNSLRLRYTPSSGQRGSGSPNTPMSASSMISMGSTTPIFRPARPRP